MENQIALLTVTPKTGVFKTGTKAGQPYHIGVCKYVDASGRSVSRISQNPDGSKLFIGQRVAGRLVLAPTNPYKYTGFDKKEVIANNKWVVQFDGETLEQAIFAHGKQPLGFVAKALVATRADATA